MSEPDPNPYEPRDSVRDAVPYEPGKPVDELMRERNVDRRPLKMGSNENPLPPPESLREAYRDVFGRLNRYPDGGSYRLRQALSEHYDWPLEGILAAGGSDEILDCLGKALLDPEDEVVVSESSFVRLPMIAGFMGASLRPVPLTDEFLLDLAGMERRITDRTRMIYIPNPNNPTGRYVSREALEQFLSTVPPRVLVVLDEAYFELIEDESYPDGRRLLEGSFPPGIVVLRTFSKSYGLAGLRAGYGLMDPELRRELDKVRPPFNVTAPAQAVAREALVSSGEYLRRARDLLPAEADRVREALEERGVETVPTSAHFFLARAPGGEGREAFDRLLDRGVITRPMDGYGLPEYLRISVLEPEDNDEFLSRWDETF